MQIGIHSDSSCSTIILRTHEFVNTRSEFCQVAPQYPVSVFGDLHNLCCCFGWPSQLVLLYHLPHHCWTKSPLPPESTTNLLFFRSFYTYLSSSSFFICVWKSNKVKTRNCRGPCTSSDLWEWTITVTISDARSTKMKAKRHDIGRVEAIFWVPTHIKSKWLIKHELCTPRLPPVSKKWQFQFEYPIRIRPQILA